MKAIRATRIPLFALAICAALGFGAQTVFAEARPCPLTTIGSCPNTDRCQTNCAAAGGDAANASCDNGCCYCPGAFI